jgi:hypothetical protein
MEDRGIIGPQQMGVQTREVLDYGDEEPKRTRTAKSKIFDPMIEKNRNKKLNGCFVKQGSRFL